MNWFEQGNWPGFWTEASKSMAPWAAGGLPGFPPMGAAMGASNPATIDSGMTQVNDLIKRSMEGWTTLMQSAGKDKKPAFDPATLARLFDPAQWSKAMATGPDFSLEHLVEGPTYATVTDLDRKVVKAQHLWQKRARDIEAYRQVNQAAWGRAFEQFSKALNDPKGPPLTSAREVLDLWLNIANDVLVEMHHRPEFQEAQRNMTRSAAEYRLQERELAEVFCTIHHIPTRTEMDEAQRTIIELRREVRSLKQRLDKGESR